MTHEEHQEDVRLFMREVKDVIKKHQLAGKVNKLEIHGALEIIKNFLNF